MMDIERVNEYTLKFFISYVDIENRGFDREEIWYNRERSEELFWEMMDEAHHQEQFSLEGPLWIQVQALEKGLEIVVTRAQLSKDGSKLELPISQDKHLDIPVHDELESVLAEHMEDDEGEEVNDEEQDDEMTLPDNIEFLIRFKDIEDLIALSLQFSSPDTYTALYHYKGVYYLNVSFTEDLDESAQEDALSQILEYGEETRLTEHYIQEYGKQILGENAIQHLSYYFG